MFFFVCLFQFISSIRYICHGIFKHLFINDDDDDDDDDNEWIFSKQCQANGIHRKNHLIINWLHIWIFMTEIDGARECARAPAVFPDTRTHSQYPTSILYIYVCYIVHHHHHHTYFKACVCALNYSHSNKFTVAMWCIK